MIEDDRLDEWASDFELDDLREYGLEYSVRDRALSLIEALRAERKEHKARIQDKDEEILMLRQDNKNWNAKTNEIRRKWNAERAYRRELEKGIKMIMKHPSLCRESSMLKNPYRLGEEALSKKPEGLFDD